MKVLLILDLVALGVTSFYLFSGKLAAQKAPVAVADNKKAKRKAARA